MENVASFPLCWPEGWPRTKSRADGRFSDEWTVYTANQRLQTSLAKLGASEVILSTSIPLRKDGLPLSKPPVDGDPGTALYFTRKGKAMCIACDKYASVEANLRALTHTIEAMRAIERHGSSELLERAFAGFAALPSPTDCYRILGIFPDASGGEIDVAYRALAKEAHPDQGGSHERMSVLNAARAEAKAALS